MKLKMHPPKSKQHSPEFTLSHIDRETLSLILSFAADGVAAYTGRLGADQLVNYSDLSARIAAMDQFVNAEDRMEQYTPLDLPNYGPVPQPVKKETA